METEYYIAEVYFFGREHTIKKTTLNKEIIISLKKAISENSFIDIDGNLYNTKSIERVEARVYPRSEVIYEYLSDYEKQIIDTEGTNAIPKYIVTNLLK